MTDFKEQMIREMDRNWDGRNSTYERAWQDAERAVRGRPSILDQADRLRKIEKEEGQ